MKIISLECYKKEKEETRQTIREVDIIIEAIRKKLEEYNPPPKLPVIANTQTTKIIKRRNCNEIYGA